MKKTILLSYALLCTAIVSAQETMYFMKGGEVVGQFNVNTEVDSLVFYAPPPPAPIPVSSIGLTAPSVVYVGQNINLSDYISIMPSNATNQSVTWSSNSSVINISNATTGAATAISAGSATITATANDGSGASNTMIITVSSETPIAYYKGIIPNAIYMGRWEKKTTNGNTYDSSFYQGSVIKVKFTGTTAKLQIPAQSEGYAFYYKIDDGAWSPSVSSFGAGASLYNLTPTPLNDGEHTLTIVGGAEPAYGLNNRRYIKSMNLILDPERTTLAPDTLNKHVEFIGDSISTVGYAGAGKGNHWNYLIGEELNIGHSHIAEPAINLGGMAIQYFDYYDGDTRDWDFVNNYVPNVVVVNLGQNGGVNDVTAYKNFLLAVRAVNPNAHILALALFAQPDGNINNTNIQAATIATGDPKIHYVVESAGKTGGGDVHPNTVQCRAIADALKPVISGYLGL